MAMADTLLLFSVFVCLSSHLELGWWASERRCCCLFYWLVLLCCFDLCVCVCVRACALFSFSFLLFWLFVLFVFVVVFDELVKFESAGSGSFVASFFVFFSFVKLLLAWGIGWLLTTIERRKNKLIIWVKYWRSKKNSEQEMSEPWSRWCLLIMLQDTAWDTQLEWSRFGFLVLSCLVLFVCFHFFFWFLLRLL